jgi:hypothetical protein
VTAIIAIGIIACLIGWAVCHPRTLLALIVVGAIVSYFDNVAGGLAVCAAILFMAWLFEDGFLRWATGNNELPSLGWDYLVLGVCWVLMTAVIYLPAALLIFGLEAAIYDRPWKDFEPSALWPILLAATGSTIWFWREMQSHEHTFMPRYARPAKSKSTVALRARRPTRKTKQREPHREPRASLITNPSVFGRIWLLLQMDVKDAQKITWSDLLFAKASRKR